MESRKCVYVLEITDSDTGEKVSIHFRKPITKKKALKVVSASNFWDKEEERILRPFIPVLENLTDRNLSVKGIFVSKTFYFKEVSRHLSVQRKPIW